MNKELMENLLSAVTNIAEILSKALEEDTPSSPEAVAVGITTHRPKRLLTKSELANLYTVSEKTIERWVKDGCSHQNIGTSEAQIYRFDPEKVELWLRRGGRLSRFKKRASSFAVISPKQAKRMGKQDLFINR